LCAFHRPAGEGGRYGSASDEVRAGLRLREEREAKREALWSALQEGEASGAFRDFDPDAFLAAMRRPVER
jgi:antitoxin ParD1/3/4